MLAIIPAREGSKGVIGKNIRNLAGIPLIAHTIRAAIESKKIDRIIVSTDSEKIAKVATEYGAEVPFLRPKSIAQDDSFILDNYNYVLDRLKIEKNDGFSIDSFVALQPTSPFRNSYDIDQAINLYQSNKTDSVISFTKESHPLEWNRVINPNNTFSNFMSEEVYNRQKYESIYRFNGAVYVYSSHLVNKNLMYSINSLAYLMPEERSLDIDTETDFLFAEFLMRNNKKLLNKK
jgi:CMP-N,N'-diacetyllegionaminic acid synthase